MYNNNSTYNFENLSNRKKFINEMNSGIYSGVTSEGEDIIILLDKGEGMEVKIRRLNKPNWYECIYYDENGFQEGISYEPLN